MIDLEGVKEKADLMAICSRDTRLKKVANTGGGEWAGPCPLPGCTCNQDGFRVQPYARPGRWLCRHCTAGKWDSVIGYIARRDHLDPKKYADLEEICRRAVGDVPTSSAPRPVHPPTPADRPPDAEWQAAALQVVAECEAALWQPKYKAVLDYLHGRGLRAETIREFRLGYCATGKPGLYGREIGGLYVSRGLVIPCVVANKIWYLKIRLVPGVPCRCQNKDCRQDLPGPGKCPKCGSDNRYLGVKGNRTKAIYNADRLIGARMALFCEGEFDCMTAHQEFGAIVPTVTFGSATNHPDLATWAIYLLHLRSILLTYDADQAGEAGAEWLEEFSGRVRLTPLPAGAKDINEFHQNGGSLLDWIVQYQSFYSSSFFQ